MRRATRLATSEALALGRSLGLSEARLLEAMSISSAGSWVVDRWSYFDHQLSSGFTLAMSAEQSSEILDLADGLGVRT